LSKRYDEIVYSADPPKSDLQDTLLELWKECIAAAEKTYGPDMTFRVAFIPEVQNALQGWLECLDQHGLTGSGPWHKVEFLTDPKKQPYGNLCLIRTEGPHAPGLGIAAWLGTKKAHSFDLRQRIGFFDENPCPIRTLIMLRADGDNALKGDAKTLFDKAIKAKRDVRIHKYEPKNLHSLMAFNAWHQTAIAEVETAKETTPDAEKIFRNFLANLGKELLGWVDAWRQPASASKGANS